MGALKDREGEIVPELRAGKLHYQSPDKLKLKDAVVEGLTFTKIIKAGNKGDAEAIFRRKFNLAPGVNLGISAVKPEGRGGEFNFKITARFNKGGYVKQYARGGSTRRVRS